MGCKLQHSLAMCEAGGPSLGCRNTAHPCLRLGQGLYQVRPFAWVCPLQTTHLQCLKGISAMIMSQIYKPSQCFKSDSNPSSSTY